MAVDQDGGEQVRRLHPCERPQRPRAHYGLAVAQHRHHPAIGALLGHPHGDGQGAPHRPAHVQVRPVPAGGAKGGGGRAERRDDEGIGLPAQEGGDRLGRVHRGSSSSGSRTIGASSRAPSATASAPRASIPASSRPAQAERLDPEQVEHGDGGAAEGHLGRIALAERAPHRQDQPKPEAVWDHERPDRVQRVAEPRALHEDERRAAGGAEPRRPADALLLARERAHRDRFGRERLRDRREPLVGHPRRGLDAALGERAGQVALPGARRRLSHAGGLWRVSSTTPARSAVSK